MDHPLKASWLPEQPKRSFSANLFDAVQEHANAFVYRFETTYGLYVMDFWEKMIVYALLGLCLFFVFWKAIIPLCLASVCSISQHFAIEPKGLYSVLEWSAQQDFTDKIIGSGIGTLNGTFPEIHL